MQRSRLFTLPREIRDIIYETTIEQGLLAPASPFMTGPRTSARNPNRSNDDLSQMSVLIHWHEYIFRPWAHVQVENLWNAAPSKFRAEIEEATSRVASRGNVCKLDVIINERQLYPTWTLLTTHASHVDRLEVQFRFFNNYIDGYDDPEEEEAVAILFDSEGPLMNALLEMLRSFLLSGPILWAYRRNDWSIGTLVLNIITQEGSIDANLIRSWTDLEVPRTETVTGEWLREGLISEMRSRLQYHTSMRPKWVSNLPKRIGALKTCVDGKNETDIPLVG